jgi:hypothetical protein
MLAYLFVVFAVAFRFLPHSEAFNFTPVAAALLFFGSRQPLRRAWIPVALLAASDVLLTVVIYKYPFTVDHLVTWAWYVAAVAIGSLLASNRSPLRVGAASLAASISFFVVSNLCVFLVWNMYPKTLAGLVTCYSLAVPFFRNTVGGDLIFTAAFFAIPALVAMATREPAHEHAQQ